MRGLYQQLNRDGDNQREPGRNHADPDELMCRKDRRRVAGAEGGYRREGRAKPDDVARDDVVRACG